VRMTSRLQHQRATYPIVMFDERFAALVHRCHRDGRRAIHDHSNGHSLRMPLDALKALSAHFSSAKSMSERTDPLERVTSHVCRHCTAAQTALNAAFSVSVSGCFGLRAAPFRQNGLVSETLEETRFDKTN